MKKNKLTSILALTLALAMSLFCLAGCAQSTASSPAVQLASGGVLCLKVNPEIAITYDADGIVTKVEGRNDDGSKILADYSGYEGKPCREVASELVTAIGEAGYFVDDIDGGKRQIIIEIETGSSLPTATFLDEVVADVRSSVSNNEWQSPVNLQGVTDFGVTDYLDTDYGPNNDGITDYNEPVTDYGRTDYAAAPAAAPTAAPVSQAAAAPASGPAYGRTDYDDTDYGPSNDGVTDYNDTDYGPGNDGVTDYNEPNTDYGVTDYQQPAPAPQPEPTPQPETQPAPGPATDYGRTNYDDGKTNYDDGKTDYNDGKTDYDKGRSDYDD